ncbi:HEAT repeat domain-containing protein [Phytohabitans sp. LJ34]|uniref:HEAT repeat domain-containing protein n=1 Tax=Phytohabitans sp. LJ34 TaxID=3452217 RepID=UPI003F8A2538
MSDQAARRLNEETSREVNDAAAAHRQYLSDLAATAAASRAGRAAEEGLSPDADEEPAMTVLTDTTLPSETRVEVMRRLSGTITRQAEYIEALLRIVTDRGDSPAVRRAALQTLDSAAFQVVRFQPHQQAYDDALHDLVDDPDPPLRETAVSTLALQHDPVVQDTLIQGLRGDGPLPVERERAIMLLAEDDHLDNLPWLREMYRGGSEDARQAAVRYMGSYPDAQQTLEDVLRNKNESAEVRQQSGASLRHLAPDRFEAVAKAIATDQTDDPRVRTACLTTLQHLGDTEHVYADTEFVDRVRVLSDEESVPDLARAARDLLRRRPAR